MEIEVFGLSGIDRLYSAVVSETKALRFGWWRVADGIVVVVGDVDTFLYQLGAFDLINTPPTCTGGNSSLLSSTMGGNVEFGCDANMLPIPCAAKPPARPPRAAPPTIVAVEGPALSAARSTITVVGLEG